jgi:ArsR family transcriptional regulator
MTDTMIPLMDAGMACCGPLGAMLSEADATAISDDFQLFAHPVRVQILTVLTRSQDAVCVCDLESAVPVKQPTVSYHLKILREAGLVTSERIGPWAYYQLDHAQLRARQARVTAHLNAWA